MKQRRSISAQVLTMVILTVSLIFIFFSSFSAMLFKTIISSSVTESNQHSVSQLNRSLDVFYQQLIYIIVQLSSNYNLKQYLTDSPEDIFDANQMQRYVNDFLQTYNGFFSYSNINIILYGNNGQIYSTYNESINIEGKGILNEQFVQEANGSRKKLGINFSHTGITSSTSNKKYVIAAKALFDAYREHTYGLILIVIDESCFSNLYSDLQQSSNRFSVISQEGLIISDSDKSKQNKKDPELLKIISDKSKTPVLYQNKNYIPISAYNKFFNCWIIQLTDYSAISDRVFSMIFSMIGISSIVLLICLLLITLSIRKVMNPIQKLTIVMKNITRHNIMQKPDRLNFEGCFEAEALGETFNIMFDELEEYINNLIAEQNARHIAELNALQNQINPHFIYNTLASVKYLIISGKNESAAAGINAFIKLLRKTITDTEELIPLKDEVELLQNYFTIQQLRYGSDIHLFVSVDENCSLLAVPKLFLQPLVENAIFHGFSDISPVGTISVYACIVNQDLQIEIIDNGQGITQEVLQNILEKSESDNNYRLSGIGLKNINERIKIIFGNQYGLKIISTINVGTQVTIHLPTLNIKPEQGGNEYDRNDQSSSDR